MVCTKTGVSSPARLRHHLKKSPDFQGHHLRNPGFFSIFFKNFLELRAEKEKRRAPYTKQSSLMDIKKGKQETYVPVCLYRI
jgi:hypothetical protein